MDRIDSILVVLTALVFLIVYYEFKRNQSLRSSMEYDEYDGGISSEAPNFSKEHLSKMINFPLIINLAHQILKNSARYSNRVKDKEFLLSYMHINTSADLINMTLLDFYLKKKLFSKHNGTAASHTKKAQKIFYLKTHKTGSSTLNNIIWRSLCLISEKEKNGTHRNCFLPRKENPGKTWSSGDIDSLLQLTGSAGSGLPFDIWNAHIKINLLSSFQRKPSALSSPPPSNFNLSTYSSTSLDKTFEDFIFQRVIPDPDLFISMVRRPSHRFESAFHWYDLSESYDSVQNQFSSKFLRQDKQYHQSMGPILRSTTHHSSRKKNRLSHWKLKQTHNSTTLLPQPMNKLQELLEDIALEVVEKLWSRASDYCAGHIQSLSLSRDQCFQLFFTRFEQSSKNDESLSFLCKEIIDELLLPFEKIFHHRSGFHSLTKELLNKNQFDEGIQQRTFERSFEQLIAALVIHLPTNESTDSPPGRFAVPSLYLLNLEDLPTSLVVLQSLLQSSSFLPLLYLPQKQQNYIKLSSPLHYQFLDLLQYYDSYLYYSQRVLSKYLLQELSIPQIILEDFILASTWLMEKCFRVWSPQDLKRVQRENITSAANLLRDLMEEELHSRQKSLELLKQLSHSQLQSLCLLYSLDNYHYVEYFHSGHT